MLTDDITNLQELVALVKRNGTTDYVGMHQQVPFRIQFHYFPKVEALVKMSGISRNLLLNQLLAVALDAFESSLDEKTKQEYLRISGSLFESLAENSRKKGDEDA
jgi:hypothetical protein